MTDNDLDRDDLELEQDGESEEPDPYLGIRCPSCNCAHSQTLETRRIRNKVRRRRQCGNRFCRHRYTTYETIEPTD